MLPKCDRVHAERLRTVAASRSKTHAIKRILNSWNIYYHSHFVFHIKAQKFNMTCYMVSVVLGDSFVITAWSVFRLQSEMTANRYERKLLIN
jgi:hypothetical protein